MLLDTSIDALDIAPVEKSGWLWKEGHRIKSWKRRWGVLQSGRLRYFATDRLDGTSASSPRSLEPLGVIFLRGACLVEPKSARLSVERGPAWRINTSADTSTLHHPKYVMAGESFLDTQAWRAAIQNHIDYANSRPAGEAANPEVAYSSASAVGSECAPRNPFDDAICYDAARSCKLDATLLEPLGGPGGGRAGGREEWQPVGQPDWRLGFGSALEGPPALQPPPYTTFRDTEDSEAPPPPALLGPGPPPGLGSSADGGLRAGEEGAEVDVADGAGGEGAERRKRTSLVGHALAASARGVSSFARSISTISAASTPQHTATGTLRAAESGRHLARLRATINGLGQQLDRSGGCPARLQQAKRAAVLAFEEHVPHCTIAHTTELFDEVRHKMAPPFGLWSFVRLERHAAQRLYTAVAGYGRTASYNMIVALLQERLVERVVAKLRSRGSYASPLEAVKASDAQMERIWPCLEHRACRANPLSFARNHLRVQALQSRVVAAAEEIKHRSSRNPARGGNS